MLLIDNCIKFILSSFTIMNVHFVAYDAPFSFKTDEYKLTTFKLYVW